MAYYAIEPFGQYPEYHRAGIIAATIANVHRGKRGRSFSPTDFMPEEPRLPKSKSQTVAEMKATMHRITAWAKKKGLTKTKMKKKKKEKK